MEIRPVAIYLPQFHPIAENDEWWGKGFTEWTNVTKAKPLLKDHYQPHLPADLGFYDLRLADAREEQARLAREYDVYGFCYYHYWFNGHRLLNRPVDEVLASGKPDLPFMFCWANENWSRRWNEEDQAILMKHEYSFEDDEQHINFLMPFFKDPRYIKVGNKPVFAIYRADLFPDMKKTIGIWRRVARENGFDDIYMLTVQYFQHTFVDPKDQGFDAAISFQPNWTKAPSKLFGSFKDKLLHKLKIRESLYRHNYVTTYREFSQRMMSLPAPGYKAYPCVTPGWDNSARKRRRGAILLGSTPQLFAAWLADILRKFKPWSKEENFIFINAWNEWAEGNHLEPCQKWGRAYLEALKETLREAREVGEAAQPINTTQQ
ncbi:MAG TPA: glycoside hydrolase family 99-like domain-containing protein [Puia sp.]|nr:glycoside hydrolase family 99-like domain-containing protein [Puia sp.]